jgi:hypothetical protein
MADSFWTEQSAWPADTLEYVFLARAVMKIGVKLHGGKWTGQEPATEIVPKPPISRPKGYGREFEFARKLLRNAPARHDLPARAVTYGKWGPLPGQELTAEEWRVAFPSWLEQHQAMNEALARFAAVKKEIAAQCVAGALKSVIRPSEGGRTSPLPDWQWNTERLVPRFACCQIDPNRPFDLGIAGEGYGFIFLIRANLEGYLAGGASVPHDPDNYWPIPKQEPAGPKRVAAWRCLKQMYRNSPGVPRSLSMQEIADKVNTKLALERAGQVSGDTIKRILNGR